MPYDPRWPEMFEEEQKRIEAAIGHYVVEIKHIGSTAVPGLAAKPIIDIMVGVRTLDDAPACINGLVNIGYEYVPEFEREFPFRRYFRKLRDGKRTYQIHLVERSNAGWWDRHVLFRDYLCSHPDALIKYERLKRELARRFRDDRGAYTEAKTGFISKVEEQARELQR